MKGIRGANMKPGNSPTGNMGFGATEDKTMSSKKGNQVTYLSPERNNKVFNAEVNNNSAEFKEAVQSAQVKVNPSESTQLLLDGPRGNVLGEIGGHNYSISKNWEFRSDQKNAKQQTTLNNGLKNANSRVNIGGRTTAKKSKTFNIKELSQNGSAIKATHLGTAKKNKNINDSK